MRRRSKQFPQPSDMATQDLQLVQIITEARELAATRSDHEGWRAFHDRTERILSAIGARGNEPSRAPIVGIDRIDRTAMTVDPGIADRAAASLMALADRPDDHQLDLADRALEEIEDALS